jgi:hypothetical protein
VRKTVLLSLGIGFAVSLGVLALQYSYYFLLSAPPPWLQAIFLGLQAPGLITGMAIFGFESTSDLFVLVAVIVNGVVYGLLVVGVLKLRELLRP